MEASTLIDPKIVDACTAVVGVVAHGPLEHGTYEAMENGGSVTRCKLYRNLECAEHQATHEALKPYQGPGRFRIPFTVWIDPEGNKLFRRDGWRRPDEFLLDMRLALEKVPGRRRSKADYTTLVKPLDEAVAALAAKRYGEAAAKFDEASKPEVAEVRRLAEEGLKEVRAFADSVLAAAKSALKAGRTRQARPALDMLARQFATLECGREALDLVKKLPFPLKSLSLRDVGSAGGRNLYLRGDGTGVVQMVSPSKEGPPGLQERRFEFSLDARGWDDLAKVFEAHRFFDIKIPGRAGEPDEPHPRLSLELWTGESGSAWKWESDKHAAFDAIHAAIIARCESAAQGRPALEGAFDPEWRPEGFTK
jgi:hypothetical protein